ncbi:hypothetical protein PACTADRAFT_757 [Pachysolen tannophilus NRRL Y-2460]|uniref:Autophagy-related protein 14 n=1 Tax=Pachysolen tannophilus NRRL Y-2460 TaxID=669874 RepID=A0A1E4U2P4_PACTA|nr:hypothetical protein PACTADRAFT_757 [Pachysolen tannophilus NRRL Y-2460]
MSKSTPSSPVVNQSSFPFNNSFSNSESITNNLNHRLIRPRPKKLKQLRSILLRNININVINEKKNVTNTHSKSLKSLKQRNLTRSTMHLQSSYKDSFVHDKNSDSDSMLAKELEKSAKLIGSNDPVEKQIRLQNLNKSRLVDTFFSIHLVNSEQPIYVSEVVEQNMNPNFMEFDFSSLKYSEFETLRIKIWCKEHSKDNGWILLLRIDLILSMLRYLGEELIESELQDENMVLVVLTDGYYLIPIENFFLGIGYQEKRDDGSRKHRKSNRTNSAASSIRPILSASFDHILKLNNLQSFIRDSEKSKITISRDIEKNMEILREKEFTSMNKTDITVKIKLIEVEIESKSKKVRKLNLEYLKKASSITSRKQQVKDTLVELSIEKEHLYTLRDEFGAKANKLDDINNELLKERSKVSSKLLEIFPIEPVKSMPHEFMILNYRLPSKINPQWMTKTMDLQIGAVLNFITQLVFLLSHYLAIPLRYPIEPFGSNSYICDPISQLKNSKLFPLWCKDNINSIHRFEYGLILLGKNIEQLLEVVGVRGIADPRNLLGNLKLLLLCLSEYGGDVTEGDNGSFGHYPDDEIETQRQLSKLRIAHIRRHLTSSDSRA